MARRLAFALLLALPAAGCAYVPAPPDVVRIVDSPADVAACRRIASVGTSRTDGREPVQLHLLTEPVRVGYGPRPAVVASADPAGDNFAYRLNVLRDRALELGATDLLLRRVHRRDWSVVEGVAYRCRR